MDKQPLGHPPEDDLLRLADGELPPRKAAAIRSHLEACWQCRTEFEEYQKTVSECVRYRKDVLHEYLPPPPRPWSDLSVRFDQIDAGMPVRRARVWIPVAAALIVLFGVIHQFRNAPPVEAAELLEKAVAAEKRRPAEPRRIRIRTGKQNVTRLITAGRESLHNEADLVPLEILFRQAQYSWEDPLSAKSYHEWRNRLSDKRDQVTTASGEYRIRTTTTSSEVVEATLKLNAVDLRAVEGTLHFRNSEWVEIKEVAADVPAVTATPEQPSITPEPIAPPASERAVTPGDELQVLVALHSIGADLGDPIEVTREGTRIVVMGAGIEPERRRQIEATLSGVPRVVVQFAQAEDPTPTAESREVPAAPEPGDLARLQARLERYWGSRVAYDHFVARALDLSDTVMSRAYALRSLAQRFSESTEEAMTAHEQRLLGNLNRAHAGGLVEQAAALQRLMHPAIEALGLDAKPVVSSLALRPGSWQSAADEVFQTARRVEVLLAALLGGAPSDSPPEALPAELAARVTQLRAVSEGYERLISRPPEPRK